MLKESEQNQMSYLEKKEKNKKIGKSFQKQNRNKKKLKM